jgi:hypothetical protein
LHARADHVLHDDVPPSAHPCCDPYLLVCHPQDGRPDFRW